jgi:O-antigen/teichoic acid export membrane protein
MAKVNYIKEILSSSILMTFGSALSRIVVIALTMMAAKMIEPNNYSILIITLSTANMLIGSLGFACSTTTSKVVASYMASSKNEDRRKELLLWIKNVLTALFVLSLLLLLFGTQVLSFLMKDISINKYLLLSVVLTAVIHSMNVSLLIATGEIKKLTIIQVSTSVMFLLLLYCVSSIDKYDFEYYDFLCILISYNLINITLVIGNWFDLTDFKGIFRISKNSALKSYYKIAAIPSFLSNMAFMLTNLLIISLISNNFGNSDAAKFATAYLLLNVALYIPQVVSTVLLPKLVVAVSSAERLKYLIVSGGLSLVISCFFWVVIISFKDLINNYYSIQFNNLSDVFLILYAAIIPISLCKVVGQLLLAQDRMYLGLKFNLLWAFVYLFGAVTVVYMKFPMEYIAYIFVLSYFSLFFAQVTYLIRLKYL